jgi:hypothetical protein
MVFCKIRQVDGAVNSMEQKTWVFCQIYVQEFHLSTDQEESAWLG